MGLQVFGGDSLLNLSAGQETLASQNQWVEDMDIEVCENFSLLFRPCNSFGILAFLRWDLPFEADMSCNTALLDQTAQDNSVTQI